MTTEDLARQLGGQLASMPKGLHILLCSLLEEAGGSVAFDVAFLAERAVRPTPKVRVEWNSDSIVLRLVDPPADAKA